MEKGREGESLGDFPSALVDGFLRLPPTAALFPEGTGWLNLT